MKNIAILLLIKLLMINNILIAQDRVKNNYRNCTIFEYNYNKGVIDSKSKKISKILTYNDNGFILEEKYFWEGELSHTNNYFYDSLNYLKLKIRKSCAYYDNYSINYIYDEKGNNINIIIYSKDDYISGHQDIKYDSNRKEIKHIYYQIADSIDVIEFYNYNEKGLLIQKKISTFRERIMEINEYYKYDSNYILIEVDIERIPELVSREDFLYWEKGESGYELRGSVPLPPFEKKIYFHYDQFKQLSRKITYYGDYASIQIFDYCYDYSGNLLKENLSLNFDFLCKKPSPIQLKNISGDPRRAFIYYYTK